MLGLHICCHMSCEQPIEVLRRLERCINHKNRIVISAITYVEMQYGAHSRNAKKQHIEMVREFCLHLDAATVIKVKLETAGAPIGLNYTQIAGHAISTGAVLVTNNTREFIRVPGLNLEDWSKA
ncbi:type II toxin-antitoxin system VapC family toxin [Citrobacter freundii]|uniref:type II toxin-antitoxin system VapC family toxin n=1 Tax=Enterobacteriaceae TaxID=543 RepID=UPI0005CFD0BB|nr:MULTISPECIES: type II toxin-antitoxin system VapC family toxin [Enterobacteriaceae]EEA2350802.1 type II toxin-antitoxin system VapC family toxin [Salmonella enterica subsp. enterica serovar Enteritidis]EEC4304730.1 type II toxin-antitoxin system VapC family toxin [Salmonella enterica subsp. enterica serovar Enteritidis]EEN2407442.1 type II toxin-antitoxin system VapC family toxin [Salmonella enterica subsp. enterica serovar Enteritidis]EES8922207.1 type II toxin-antitoxin system VapC family 